MVTMAVASWSPAVSALSVAASSANRSSEPCCCRSARTPGSSFLAPKVVSFATSPVFGEKRIALTRRLDEIQRQWPRSPGLVTRSLFGLGVPELAVIAGVAVLLFGPKKLPELGKNLGQAVKSFQEAAKEFESEIKNPASESPARDKVNGDETASTTGGDKESS